jgi:hypothetical protein
MRAIKYIVAGALIGWFPGTFALAEDLPTVDWARETLREKIAEYQGVPVDDYTPMPNIVMQWDSAGLQTNGERWWLALFRYEGKNAFLRGHGTSVMQAAAMAEGMITQSAEFTELQRQQAAQFEAQHPQPQDNTQKGSVLLKSPRIPYPPKALQAHISGQVILRIKVENGNIVNIEASGPPELANPASDWVKSKWEFSPKANGTFTLPATFNAN